MRTRAISMLVLLLPLPACAAHMATVDQIRQMLGSAHGQSDAKIAGDLSNFELSERLSPATLAQFEAEAPGPRSQEALVELADASAFLLMPESEVVQQPPPDTAGFHRIIDHAIEYLGRTIPNLPNFLASRETLHFEDSPFQQEIDNSRSVGAGVSTQSVSNAHLTIGKPYYLPLYSTGKTSVQVTYRAGREVPTTEGGGLREAERMGLTTQGEFGPILAVVLSDALHNKLYWEHWEPGAAGPVAVFRFTVPQSGSHYTVAYPSENGIKKLSPAYHGLLTLDPATGAVLRLTIIAEMQRPYQNVQVGIAVEYGPVQLGDKSYICPVHAVVLSREPVPEEAGVVAPQLRTCLNDVTFTNYHLFHANAHIVSSTQEP